jgi:hypothetical protein
MTRVGVYIGYSNVYSGGNVMAGNACPITAATTGNGTPLVQQVRAVPVSGVAQPDHRHHRLTGERLEPVGVPA